jgi:hypothetical protein
MRAVDSATKGRSAKANMSVLISTAELAGRIASAHAARDDAHAVHKPMRKTREGTSHG